MKRSLHFLLILAFPALAAADNERPHFERVRDLAKETEETPASEHFQTKPLRAVEVEEPAAEPEPAAAESAAEAEIEALRGQLEILGGSANPARIGQIEERLSEIERRLSRLESKVATQNSDSKSGKKRPRKPSN